MIETLTPKLEYKYANSIPIYPPPTIHIFEGNSSESRIKSLSTINNPSGFSPGGKEGFEPVLITIFLVLIIFLQTVLLFLF